MLRNWVLGVGVAMLAVGLLLWAGGHRLGSLMPLVLWGAILACGIYFERYRYKPELDRPPGPDWVTTNERSQDARGIVTVWYNPASGERAYVRTPPNRL